jgi:hypothetical protein
LICSGRLWGTSSGSFLFLLCEDEEVVAGKVVEVQTAAVVATAVAEPAAVVTEKDTKAPAMKHPKSNRECNLEVVCGCYVALFRS